MDESYEKVAKFWSGQSVTNKAIIAITLVVAVIVSILYLVKWRRPPKPTQATPSADDRARLWVRHAASRAQEAVTLAKTHPIDALEAATEAQMAATMAREYEQDPGRLTQAVGVDFVEFWTYLGKVRHEIKTHLRKA